MANLKYLRGNLCINYEQLGLKFRLYSCEVLFNRGLCYIYLSDMEQGMQDLQYAMKEKQTPEHDVIDDAIRENASVQPSSKQISFIGLHRLLRSRRRHFPTIGSQDQERTEKGLPRVSKTYRCHRRKR